MIARYTRERGFKGSGKDNSLTLNKDYIVISIMLEQGFYSDGSPIHPKFSLQCDDDNYPCLFDLRFFDLVDTRIPPNWIFEVLPSGACCLGPKEFDCDFWDLFNDGNEEAEKLFEKTVQELNRFHGL